jgi:hypothetical protein
MLRKLLSAVAIAMVFTSLASRARRQINLPGGAVLCANGGAGDQTRWLAAVGHGITWAVALVSLAVA